MDACWTIFQRFLLLVFAGRSFALSLPGSSAACSSSPGCYTSTDRPGHDGVSTDSLSTFWRADSVDSSDRPRAELARASMRVPRCRARASAVLRGRHGGVVEAPAPLAPLVCPQRLSWLPVPGSSPGSRPC